MTFTPIAKGTPNWDSPLNLALTQLDNSISSGSASALQATNNLSDLTNVPQARSNLQLSASTVIDSSMINVKDHGALGNGTADDTAAIQAALNAATSGQIVCMPVGIYATTASITIPPCVTLCGATKTFWFPSEGGTVNGVLAPQAKIMPKSSFSGTAVVKVVDKDTGAYSAASGNQSLINITIDGTNLPGGNTVDGFQSYGSVFAVTLKDCSITQMGGMGINTVFHSGSGEGFGLLNQVYMDGCVVYNTGNHGIHLSGTSDSTIIGCHVIAATGNAWDLTNVGNTRFIGCKGEWSAVGWNINWPNGTGNIPRQSFVSCSSDHNTGDGFFITGTQAGGFVLLSNCDFHGDGRTSSASSCGLHISATAFPVIVENCGVFIDSTSTSGYGPARGFRADTSPTLVSVSNSYFQGATTGWSTDSTGNVYAGSGVLTSNGGTPTAPTAATFQAATVGQLTTGSIFSGGIQAFGNIQAETVGTGITVKEGTNAKMGITAAMTTGAITVSTTAVTANSRIFLTAQTTGGTPGALRVSARTAGTSFTITSSSNTDTSTVAWFIVEPS